MSQEISTFPQRLGAGRLRKLKDVSSATPTNGQALVYNAVTGHWEPQTITPDLSAIEADIAQLQTDVTDVTGDLATHTANTSNPHSVTLAQTGNTVIDDTAIPATDTNTADVLLDNLANRIKAITGEAGWKDAPDTTLTVTAANIATVAAHIADTNNPHVVTLAQVLTPLTAQATGTLNLTTTIQDVPSCSVVLPDIGSYAIFVNSRWTLDIGSEFIGVYLGIGGSDVGPWVFTHSVDVTGNLSLFYYTTTTGTNTTVQLRAKENVSGTSINISSQTRMLAFRVA